MRARVIGGVKDLARDQRSIVTRARADMVRVVRKNIRSGNRVAKGFAKRRSGAHGPHYPNAFSAEMHGIQSALTGGGLTSGEFGPESDKLQGGMSFERGSRNQPAHHELADAADITTPQFVKDVHDMPDGWAW